MYISGLWPIAGKYNFQTSIVLTRFVFKYDLNWAGCNYILCFPSLRNNGVNNIQPRLRRGFKIVNTQFETFHD